MIILFGDGGGISPPPMYENVSIFEYPGFCCPIIAPAESIFYPLFSLPSPLTLTGSSFV